MLWELGFAKENDEYKPSSVQEVINWFANILKELLAFIASEEGWVK